MRITFVGGSKIPAQGGIENYVMNLAKYVAAKGHSPWIVCRGDISKESIINGIKVTQLKCKENQFSIMILNIRASWMIFRKGKCTDLVNYQSIYLPFFYEWIPKLRGIKVCHTQHSFAQDNPKHGKVSKIIISSIYRVSRLVISPITTVSKYNQELIKRRLLKKSTVINCGVEMPTDKPDTDILERFGIVMGKYYLSIGRIDQVKNLDILISSFMRHPKHVDVQLVICGNFQNVYGEKLKELSKDDKRVIFTGPVYGDDKETLLNNCMAYCLVSTSEGFPIALLEAMAHANPCICSNIAANRETLPKDIGLWCEERDVDSLYDKMLELESSLETYQTYGIKAQEFVRDNLTWEKIADKYIDYAMNLIK